MPRRAHSGRALRLACAGLAALLAASLCFAASPPAAAQQSGITELVSRAVSGGPTNNLSAAPSVSADGRYVAFSSYASNLVAGDTNGANDVFRHDRQTGATTRVSVSSAGGQANGSSISPMISPNGRYVAFTSWATNLAPDYDEQADLYIHDCETHRTSIIAAHTHGAPLPDAYSYYGTAGFSGNSEYVAFTEAVPDPDAGEGAYRDCLFVYDTSARSVQLVDARRPDGYPIRWIDFSASLSYDGRYVAFESIETMAGGDSNYTYDIFAYDRGTRTASYASVSSDGRHGNAESRSPVISADGRYVAFDSLANNLVPDDTNASYDVFVRDTWLGTTTRASVSSAGVQGNYSSRRPSISANGRYVVFESDATNLVGGDGNFSKDVFLRDMWEGTTTRVSLAATGAEGAGWSAWPHLSANGMYVAFYAAANNLVPGEGVHPDVFLRIRSANRFADPPPGPSLTLEVPAEPVIPDGLTDHAVTALVVDASGRPTANATVGFTIVPAVGDLSADTATTGADGRATVRYLPPALKDLGDDAEVTVVAWSGVLGDTGVIEFEPPEVFREAVPRYYQSGWGEWHALLPPDPDVPAVIKARLTYEGKPVTDYPVTLTITPRDAVYDGDFMPRSDALLQEPHRLQVLTDANGWVVVLYQTAVQASRTDAVSDEVIMTGRPFGYMASWIVETGIDLEFVDVHPTGAAGGRYTILGQPESLEIEVRDRLHPGFQLANYNDGPGPVVDPDTDYPLGVRLDISHEASTEEFLRLIEVPFSRVPRMTTLHTFFYPASGRTFLHTSAPGNLDGRPWVTPWIEGASMHWLEIHLETGISHQLVRDSGEPLPDMEEAGNNYRLLAIFTNELLDTWVEFIRGNPCGANSDFTRSVKCWVSMLSMTPGADIYFGPASTALDICETVFGIINGNWTGAATTASTSQLGEFADWLENSRPDLLSTTDLSLRGWGKMKRLDRVINYMDCYWALEGMLSQHSAAVSACATAWSLAATDSAQRAREADLMVLSLLDAEGQLSDAVIVAGADSVQLQNGGGQAVPLTPDGVAFSEAQGYFSISSDGTVAYMVPRGSYTLTATSTADTYVYLYRREASPEGSTRLLWADAGSEYRRLTVSLGASSAPSLSVDVGANGSVDRLVAPVSAAYLANPTSLQATEVGGSAVRLTWPTVPGASGYRVYYGTESRYLPSFEGYTSELVTAATTVDVAGLDLAANAYYFAVTANDALGNGSLYSAEAMAGSPSRAVPVHLPLVLSGCSR